MAHNNFIKNLIIKFAGEKIRQFIVGSHPGEKNFFN